MNKTIIEKNLPLQKELFSFPEKNPFNCTQELFLELKEAIDLKKPFSMIRLGDGEGRILGYPEIFEPSVYLNQVLTYQYGPKVIDALKEEFQGEYIDKSMLQLKSFIEEAIESADIIGAPSWIHFRAPVDDNNFTPLTAQSVCLDYTSRLKNTKKIFDHFIFKPFHKDGYFDKLLESVDKLTVISHTDMSDKLIARFNLQKCNHIKIPGHQSFMKSDNLHYPDEYKKILLEINKISPGDVVFVAAGYLGKLYCSKVKENSGIAIDIGSIFDGWCGKGRKDSIGNEEQRI